MSTESSGVAYDPSANNPYNQFLLFGDSLTQFSARQALAFGFATALQDVYIRRLDVINRGLSGYTTQNAIQVLPRFMPSVSQAKVRIMTIFFGANDSCMPGWLQHVPLDQYLENLKAIIHHPVVVAQAPVILLVTPPPIDEYQLGSEQRTAANTMRYAHACRELGYSLNLPVVDLWSAFMKAAGWEEGQPLIGSKERESSSVLRDLLCDGLHFHAPAYQIMFDEVMRVIREKAPEVAPDDLKFTFPEWQQAPK